jgi:hypothetical protein
MQEKDTAYKPEPTPLPAPGPEHTAEGLAEKLYEAWASYWKAEAKRPAWKDVALSAKLRWRAVANLAIGRGPFDDPDEHRRMAEDDRAAFQHVRDMAFADTNPRPKSTDDKNDKDKHEKDKDDKNDKDAKHPKEPPVGPPFPHK